jgi:Ca2+-binding EF-hand superfamily protein
VLRKHCDKIKRVSAFFKNVDTDDDGIIDHDQLFALLEKLEIKSDIDLE